MAIIGNEIGKDLIEALGLPEQLVAFSLHCRAGQLVRVECEYYPQDGKAITTALMAYALVPRSRPAPVASGDDAPCDFDTWYRKRIDEAHAKFMERSARRCPSDWRAFPPEQISRYFGIPIEELA